MTKSYWLVVAVIIIVALIALFATRTAGQKKIEKGIPDNLAISNELGG